MSRISNWKRIDNYMQRGYSFLEEYDSVSTCKEWEKAWRGIVLAMDSGNYHSIEDFDEDFSGLQSVFNWASDYEAELHNAIIDDISFAQIRIDFCTEYLERVSDKEGHNSLSMRRAIAETYFRMGMRDEGEKAFEEITEEYPAWAWGWIGWADEYSFYPEHKDCDKAIKLLSHALEIDGIDEIRVIKERLQEVYRSCGMDEEADAIILNEEDFGVPLSEINNIALNAKMVIDEFTDDIAKASERKAKVYRNDPCPCGSGKKYKHCCGAN